MKTSPNTVRTVGCLTVISALAGTALALAIIFWPEQVPDTQWSFPFDASSYVAFQLSFFLHDLTLIPGLALVAAWAWPSASRATRIGLGLTVGSMVAGAAIELAAVSAAKSSMTSTLANVLGASYGVMSLGFGVGFIMAGLAFRRQPLVPGAIGRWTYLLIGVWTFFPMLPSLFMPMVWGRITIGIWFLLYAGIGVVILRSADPDSATEAGRRMMDGALVDSARAT
ncbi:MAG: hypothetical protein M3N33_06655 [Actinomycetota bacterium]|nr:hypothetical protein [Actinomycetota bacterium]